MLFDRVSDRLHSTRVVIDDLKAGYLATRHLIDQGYVNIVHVTGDTRLSVYGQRLEGFRRAMGESGIGFLPEMAMGIELSEAGVRELLLRDILLRDSRPDALFIANDSCAAIALMVLREQGLSVPADMAVVGFNNDAVSRVTDPPITTIDYPAAEMGKVIGSIVIEQLTSPERPRGNRSVVMDAPLLVRASSLKVR